MHIWCASSAERITTNSRMCKNATASLKLDSAKNMTVCGQICLREFKDFTISNVEFFNLPKGIAAKYNFVENVVYNDGVPYPDKLSRKVASNVKAHATEIIYATFYVPKTADTGEYNIDVKITTDKGEFTANVILKVYSAVLPDVKEQTFNHEYFYTPDTYFNNDTRLGTSNGNFYKFKLYSNEWWDFIKEQVKALNDLRVNVFYLSATTYLVGAGSRRISDTEWQFNFELLEKALDIYLSNGQFSRIAVASNLASVNGDTVQAIDYDGKIVKLSTKEKQATNWLKAYFTALYDFFKKKGVIDMVYMHLEDEPHFKKQWVMARKICRECMPGVPCGEPIDTGSVAIKLGGECDVYIPRLEVYQKHKKYFKTRQEMGDEVWCYSCCFPEEPWWLNKFIDLPHVYSRLIKWACFSNGITGFLHWGFSYWYVTLYGVNPDARFKGDGFIVYPDVENGSVLLSARAVATRDGIQEYELLSMLYKKSPEKAIKISKKVAASFDKFNGNNVDAARREVLELLEN